MSIRRVNLFGGAGCGKSTCAAGLFYHLKCGNVKVESVSEYIKEMAYERKVPESFDQLHIFSQQLRSEDLRLRHMPYIVTDSPLMMQTYYARRHNFPGWQELIALARLWEEQHPSLNIFLGRNGITYQQEGRYETAAEADVIDQEMAAHLLHYGVKCTHFLSKKFEDILEHVRRAV